MKLKTGANSRKLRLPDKGDVVMCNCPNDGTLQLAIVVDRIDTEDMQILSLPDCNTKKVSIIDYEPYLGNVILSNDKPFKE